MQTQANFCLCFTKINTKPFFGCAKASVKTKSISFTQNYKIIFLIISMRAELFSTPKIQPFLTKPSPKVYESFPSNAIP